MQEKIEFWDNVYGFNMKAIKKIALQEPLVDAVNADQINTSTCQLISIDINTMSKEDIPFKSEFELRVSRDDHIHALVIWFDIDFDASHKQVRYVSQMLVLCCN